ncbi:MAG: LacI family DNA-binding transcriptional regulator [Anaerolineae bacterium]|nr:LacI family transcriptional regulator [Thermoflexales bacterium]MDW8395214.1 LacI family DNA-binding transcriptional regulator [Anaerolineae bacterium]
MNGSETPKTARRPTLRDVARAAGVSIGTASQALNNRPSVQPETRERVLSAASALGYRVHHAHKQPSLSVVGMLVKHDPGAPLFNPFFSLVQAGVEQECRLQRLSLMVATIEVDASNRPVEWPRMVEDDSADGLLLLGANIEPTADALHRRLPDKPIVLVDSYAPGYHFDSVLIDNLNGAAQAVNHLIALGHRHIGLIGSNPASPPDILERRQGYINTLIKHGITRTYIEDSLMTREEGAAALHRLMARAPEVTAVFVVNDDTAIGVLHAALDMGLRVPEDLSIVGFDDIALASEVRPPLTTIHVPKVWLGRLGVRQLVARSQSPQHPQVTLGVATRLVERATTAMCARQPAFA